MNTNKFLMLVLVVSASTMAGKCQSLGRTDVSRRGYKHSVTSCGNVKDDDKCNRSYESSTNDSCVWK